MGGAGGRKGARFGVLPGLSEPKPKKKDNNLVVRGESFQLNRNISKVSSVSDSVT